MNDIDVKSIVNHEIAIERRWRSPANEMGGVGT